MPKTAPYDEGGTQKGPRDVNDVSWAIVCPDHETNKETQRHSDKGNAWDGDDPDDGEDTREEDNDEEENGNDEEDGNDENNDNEGPANWDDEERGQDDRHGPAPTAVTATTKRQRGRR